VIHYRRFGGPLPSLMDIRGICLSTLPLHPPNPAIFGRPTLDLTLSRPLPLHPTRTCDPFMQVRKTLWSLLGDRGYEVSDKDRNDSIASFKEKCTNGGIVNDPDRLTLRAHKVGPPLLVPSSTTLPLPVREARE